MCYTKYNETETPIGQEWRSYRCPYVCITTHNPAKGQWNKWSLDKFRQRRCQLMKDTLSVTPSSRGATNKANCKLLVSVENWLLDTDKTEHVYVFEITKQHQKTLHSILRQLFEHPETKFSSKLKRIET